MHHLRPIALLLVTILALAAAALPARADEKDEKIRDLQKRLAQAMAVQVEAQKALEQEREHHHQDLDRLSEEIAVLNEYLERTRHRLQGAQNELAVTQDKHARVAERWARREQALHNARGRLEAWTRDLTQWQATAQARLVALVPWLRRGLAAERPEDRFAAAQALLLAPGGPHAESRRTLRALAEDAALPPDTRQAALVGLAIDGVPPPELLETGRSLGSAAWVAAARALAARDDPAAVTLLLAGERDQSVRTALAEIFGAPLPPDAVLTSMWALSAKETLHEAIAVVHRLQAVQKVRVTMDHEATPLYEVLEDLAEQTPTSWHPDGESDEIPIAVSKKDAPVLEALHAILAPHALVVRLSGDDLEVGLEGSTALDLDGGEEPALPNASQATLAWRKRYLRAISWPIRVSYEAMEVDDIADHLSTSLGISVVALPSLVADERGYDVNLMIEGKPAVLTIRLLCRAMEAQADTRWEVLLLGTEEDLERIRSAPPLSHDTLASRVALARLDRHRQPVRLDGVALGSVLESLGRAASVDVWMSPSVQYDQAEDVLISLHAEDLSGRSLLHLLTAPHGLHARLLDGIVIVEEPGETAQVPAILTGGPWSALENVRVDLDVREAGFREVLATLAESTGRRFHIDVRIREDVEDVLVTARLRNAALPTILHLLHRLAGAEYAWVVRGDAIWLTRSE